MRRIGPWLALAVLAAALAWWRTGAQRAREVPTPSAPTHAPVPAPAEARSAEPPERVALAPAPAPETPTRVVRVRSLASFAQDAPSVPEVAFEVFVQRERVPEFSRASFLPPAPIAPGDAPLARGRTDAQGRARLELPAAGLRCGANGLPVVCLRVVEPGYQQQVLVGREAEDEPGALEVLLPCTRGATLRGRVVDAHGAPVTADVRLCQWSTARGARQLDRGRLARTLCEGGFEVYIEREIADGVLLADARELGTGCLTGVSVALEATPPEPTLVVHGAGTLRGRIVDAGGTPAAGVELLVVLAELDDERGGEAPEPRASLLQLEGLGHTRATLSSDSEGRFALAGLRAGDYLVRARCAPDPSGYPRFLTPRAVAADGAELALVLARPSVRVRLLDVDGSPWSRPEARPARFFVEERSQPPWPPNPVVHAYAVDERDGSALAGAELRGKRLSPSEVLFEVAEGARVLLCVLGPGFDGSPREVELPPRAGAVEVEFRAQALGELAALTVHVTSGGAEIVDAYGESLVLELQEVRSAVALLPVRSEWARPPIVFRAPAGSYRVVVAGQASLEFFHGTLQRERTLGRAEAEVQLVARRAQELTLDLAPGARLEVTLAGGADTSDRAAIEAREGAPPVTPELEAERARRAASAELFLLAPGRRAEPVQRVAFAYADTTAAGQHLLSEWPLGQAFVSACLPSGRYTLLGRLPGGREARMPVELVAGETAKATLRF